MTAPIVVGVPFRDHPARTLVVSCCDGRYIDAVEQLLADQGMPHHDLVTYPGGPAHLDPMSAFLEHQAIADALDFMIRAHETQRVVLIGHRDCAYYISRYGRSDVERQERDLKVAARHVRARHGQVAVDLYYLEPLDGGGVAARVVAPASDDDAWVL